MWSTISPSRSSTRAWGSRRVQPTARIGLTALAVFVLTAEAEGSAALPPLCASLTGPAGHQQRRKTLPGAVFGLLLLHMGPALLLRRVHSCFQSEGVWERWIAAGVVLQPGLHRGPMDANCDNRLLYRPYVFHVRNHFYLF